MFVPRHLFHRIAVLALATLLSLCAIAVLAEAVRTHAAASASDARAYEAWGSYGGSSENIKYSALTQITPQNIGFLRVAWTYSSDEASETNRTDMKVNPLIVDGTLYGLNPQLAPLRSGRGDGKVKWVYDPGQVSVKGKNIGRGDFASSTKISRGVAFIKDRRRISASSTRRVADMRCTASMLCTGKLITSFGDNGIVDMHDNLDASRASA